MTSAVVLLAMALHMHGQPAPLDLVASVYNIGGLPYVALVSCENPRWDPEAVKREPRGHTSYGLAMIDDEWWPQYRGDLPRHLAEGWHILHDVYGMDPAKYNGGKYPNARARAWGRHVRARQAQLEHDIAELARVRATKE